jgi:outer membrane protein assembly factor BamE (lipoprotein component of BamABCDE complex)
LTTAALALATLASGCARIRDHKGYVADSALIASVQPGVDNIQSVQGTLGRPTFVSQYGDPVWYYIARDTRQIGFSSPHAVDQMTLAVRFDRAGNVVAVDRTGLEQTVSLSPDSDKTPTLGRNRGFFRELFGNIGRVGGSGTSGGTADNPQ